MFYVIKNKNCPPRHSTNNSNILFRGFFLLQRNFDFEESIDFLRLIFPRFVFLFAGCAEEVLGSFVLSSGHWKVFWVGGGGGGQIKGGGGMIGKEGEKERNAKAGMK
jgi:hypothetical protein